MSYSIVPAMLIGVIRFRVVDVRYRSFLYFIILAFLNEVCSSIVINGGGSNAFNTNIYMLAECLLLLHSMKLQAIHANRAKYYTIGGCIAILVWLGDYIVAGNIFIFSSWYPVFYSILLVFGAIDLLNGLLVIERKKLIGSTKFWLCCGILVYFSYKTITEIFYGLHLYFSNSFATKIDLIMAVVNVLSNIMYAIAVLCMPKKQNFSLPF